MQFQPVLCIHIIDSVDDYMAMQTRKKHEILEKAKETTIRAQQQQKEVYNRKDYSPEVYKLGSFVLKKDFSRRRGRVERWMKSGSVLSLLLEFWGKDCIVSKQLIPPTSFHV